MFKSDLYFPKKKQMIEVTKSYLGAGFILLEMQVSEMTLPSV